MKEEVKKPKPEPLLIFIIDLFNKIPEIKDSKDKLFFKSDGYIILCSGVVCDMLYKLYCKLIQVDVPPIETLSPKEKTVYWELAKRYYTDQNKAVIASKAAYILTLITNSN